MKKILFVTACLLIISLSSHAQNTFPSSGNVGIGTTTPYSLLSLGGAVQPRKLALWESGATFYGFGIYHAELQMSIPNGSHMSFGTLSSDGNNTFAEKMRMVGTTGNFGIGVTNPNFQLSLPDENASISLGENIFINGQGSTGRITNNAYINDGWKLLDNTSRATTIELRDNGIIEMYGTQTVGQLDWKKMFGFDAVNNKVYFPSGNIGIGVDEPLSKLSIYGTGAEGWNSGIELNREGGGKAWMVVDNDGLKIRTAASNDHIYFRNSGNETNMIISDDGNVGIGTTTPTPHNGGNALVVQGASGIGTGRGIIEVWDYDSGKSVFQNVNGDTYIGQLDKGSGNGNLYLLHGGSGTSASIGLIVEGATGNVGIGTTTPPADFKLAVAGKILAEEVQVSAAGTSPWPDYVFSNDYNLRTLTEVENFITENSHLPDVPSEAKVKEEGISLGEMNAILLKKIEELTLYAIEQEKANKNLEEKVESQRKELDQIKSLLEQIAQ